MDYRILLYYKPTFANVHRGTTELRHACFYRQVLGCRLCCCGESRSVVLSRSVGRSSVATDGLTSGKCLHNYGKSPFFMGKSTINGPFSMAMLNYLMVNWSDPRDVWTQFWWVLLKQLQIASNNFRSQRFWSEVDPWLGRFDPIFTHYVDRYMTYMEVSWNRGTPESSTYRWDFPL